MVTRIADDKTDLRCTHCGLPMPTSEIDPSREEQFCCLGCRTVFSMIHTGGWDRFYRLRQSSGADPRPARTTDRRYGEFDDATFRSIYVRSLPDSTHSIEFYLEGVHCAACVWLLEKLPMIVEGVIESRLELRRSLVRIRWDDSAATLSQIARTLDSLGYPPHPAKDVTARDMRRREDHRFLIRIGVAAACAGNIMTLSFALYGGVFAGIDAQYSHLFRWTSMLFGLVSLFWPGSLFFRGAWAAIRTRTAHLDLPIALGLAAGGTAGTVNALLGRGEIYFDSLSLLVLLLLVGRWIQQRQQRWATDAVELLFSLTPSSARRVEGDTVAEVPVEGVRFGDIVEIRSGESLPTDGIITEGRSDLDRSLLTGESKSIPVNMGHTVHAGTINLTSRIRIRVKAVGTETRIGKLMRLVETCQQQRSPIVQLADRIAGRFVTVVLGLSVFTVALWWWLDPSRAIDHGVALLIVCCPCALGLATPLAMTIALGRAARRRILIKGGDVLERLAGYGTILLDKTGTITAGHTSVVSYFGDPTLKPLIASLESGSAHPVARALVEAFDDDTETLCLDVKETIGGGMSGVTEGRTLVIGSPEYVQSQGVIVPLAMKEARRRVIDSCNTPVLVAVDGKCEAVVGLGDPIREDASAAIGRLRELGWSVRILSGDHPDVVASVGRQLGISEERASGGITPEGKSAYVHNLAEAGTVVMIGDGVNDAAALSSATVGIAVHGGAEASLAAADVYLNRPGLTPIVELIHASRNTLRVIRRALIVSLCYNAIAASLAVAGLIGPLVAAVLMPTASFTVLAMAFASRTFGDRS